MASDSNQHSPPWLQAVIDMLPLSLAVIPWGILTGSLAIEAGLTPWQAQCMSLFVFAGAAQLASLNLIQIASPLSAILGSTFVISSRHLLYSAVFRTFALTLPRHKRYLLAFVLTDEMFAVAEVYRQKHGQFHFQYVIAAGLAFHLAWNLSTFAGIVLGSSIENMAELGFEFAIAAIFIAMVIPHTKSLPSLAAVVLSAIVMIFVEVYELPNGLLVASVVGMLGGFLTDQWQRQRKGKRK